MNKAELIDVVATRIDTSKKEASEAVQAVVDAITEAVAKGQKVSISGFGVFEKAERAARTYRAPSTGEAIRKVATAVPRFRPGGGFKASVSGQGDDEGDVAGAAAAGGADPADSAAEEQAPAAETATRRPPAKKSTAAGAKAPAKKAPARRAAARKAAPAPEAAAPEPEVEAPASTESESAAPESAPQE